MPFWTGVALCSIFCALKGGSAPLCANTVGQLGSTPCQQLSSACRGLVMSPLGHCSIRMPRFSSAAISSSCFFFPLAYPLLKTVLTDSPSGAYWLTCTCKTQQGILSFCMEHPFPRTGEGMGRVNGNEGEKSQNSSAIGKNWEGSNGISEGSWAVGNTPSDLV